MRFLSSPRTPGEGKGRLRKESAPSPSPTPAPDVPKAHSKSLDQGVMGFSPSPRRTPPPIPSIALSKEDSPSLQEDVTVSPSTIRAASPRPHTSTSSSPADVPDIWRSGSVRGVSPTGPPDQPAMDVPLRLDRRTKRPNIHVFIPEPHLSQSLAYNPHRLRPDGQALDGRRRSSSSPRRPRTSASVESFTSQAIFSPRPTLTPPHPSPPGLVPRGLGLESTGPRTALPMASASSTSISSQDTLEDDGSSSGSRRTSMSSLAPDPLKARSSPTNSQSPIEAALASTRGVGPVTSKPKAPTPLRSKLSPMDFANKPLPPEPGRMAPAPLAVATRPAPLSSAAARVPRSPQVLRTPSFQASSPSPLRSPATPGSVPSLKSKYSSSDLDSIDQAFRRSSPKHEPSALLEAEQALEAQLSTINEAGPFQWDELPGLGGPLQISRGPMEMNPSRPPPTPPTSKVHILERGRLHPRARAASANQAASFRNASARDKARGHGSVVDSGRRWTNKALRLRAHDKARQTSAPEGHRRAEPSSSSTTLTMSAFSTEHSSPVAASAAPSMGGADSDGLSILTMEEALLDFTPHERSFDVTSPYASSTALPLSPESLSPKTAEFPGSTPDEPPLPRRESVVRTPQVKVGSGKDQAAEKAEEGKGDAGEDDHDGLGPLERRGRRTSVVTSIISLAVSDIPDWYLDMPTSAEYAARRRTVVAAAAAERNITAQSAEAIILKILGSLDNLQDLFSTAVVSRGFYRTFKKYELALTKGALKSMSAAAWELREVTAPGDEDHADEGQPTVLTYTPASYLRDYTRDMYTMVALKSLILARCRSFLRPATISALAGEDDERSLELDNAFWRVWTFCHRFGDDDMRAEDRATQLDWLRGKVQPIEMNEPSSNFTDSFALGNRGGLSPEQLYDMLEVWTCLGVLIRGFQGRTQLAREFGIYDHLDVAEGDVDREASILEEWVSYLLTLGPSVILDLATPSDQAGPQGFVVAAENGWTTWSLPPDGSSRSTFVKEAVTRVYQERMGPCMGSRSRSASSASTQPAAGSHSVETGGTQSSADRLAVPALAPVGDKAEPTVERQPSTTPEPRSSPMPKQPRQQVVDPVDRAIWQLVGMGFPVNNARKALAQTDTGTNLDVAAAIDLCLRWAEEMRSPLGAPPEVAQAARETSFPEESHVNQRAPLIIAG